jgi:ribosomal protein S18 acetylase RimI-like enzyme
MIQAKNKDKELVIRLLVRSFKENQSVNFIVHRGDRKLDRIGELMGYAFRVCRLFGEVWLSNDRKACALVLYPDLKQASIRSIWLDMRLAFQTIGLKNVPKALNREAQVKKLQPKVQMAYLWFIGVDPLHQRKGIGSTLLAEILADANAKNLPVYLETSTLKNLPWYKGLGFEIYNQLELGYTLFFLKHEPAQS